VCPFDTIRYKWFIQPLVLYAGTPSWTTRFVLLSFLVVGTNNSLLYYPILQRFPMVRAIDWRFVVRTCHQHCTIHKQQPIRTYKKYNIAIITQQRRCSPLPNPYSRIMSMNWSIGFCVIRPWCQRCSRRRRRIFSRTNKLAPYLLGTPTLSRNERDGVILLRHYYLSFVRSFVATGMANRVPALDRWCFVPSRPCHAHKVVVCSKGTTAKAAGQRSLSSVVVGLSIVGAGTAARNPKTMPLLKPYGRLD
jgi:hypothetical protein